MKAVAYYRVSTSTQGRSGLGLEAQKSSVAKIIAHRQMTVLAEFLEVESGKRSDRPELLKALRHAKVTGAVLVIAKLDRLSRNAAFLLTLRDSGVQFLAADIPDANDLTIGVLAVIAQAEREAISRRTTEALDAVKSRIAQAGFHISQRSGRTILRLGNPNGSKALLSSQRDNERISTAVRKKAQARAEELREIVQSIESSGRQSYSRLASELNTLGVLSPRGERWYPSTARSLAIRLGYRRSS